MSLKTRKAFARDAINAFGAGSHEKGLQALEPIDRKRISVKNPTALAGSVNIDATFKKAQPNSHRWDYVVGRVVSSGIELHWIEVHPAQSSSHSDEVMRKLKWLTALLKNDPLDDYRPRQFVWIASGSTTLSPRSPQLKKLANLGCHLVGHLKI